MHSCQTSEGIIKDAVDGINPCNSGDIWQCFVEISIIFHWGCTGETSPLRSPGACWQCLKGTLCSANQIHSNPSRLEFVARGYKDRQWQTCSSLPLLLYLSAFFSLQIHLNSKFTVCHVHFEDKKNDSFEWERYMLLTIFCSQSSEMNAKSWCLLHLMPNVCLVHFWHTSNAALFNLRAALKVKMWITWVFSFHKDNKIYGLFVRYHIHYHSKVSSEIYFFNRHL